MRLVSVRKRGAVRCARTRLAARAVVVSLSRLNYGHVRSPGWRATADGDPELRKINNRLVLLHLHQLHLSSARCAPFIFSFVLIYLDILRCQGVKRTRQTGERIVMHPRAQSPAVVHVPADGVRTVQMNPQFRTQ